MVNFVRMLGGLLLVLLVSACGGGGGSAGSTAGGGGGGTPASLPASVEIFTSSLQLSSGPGSSASFTVVVKDANNQAMPAQSVTFSASSGNLSGALPVPQTGAAGEAITNVSLTPGTDRSNRIIVVTARAGNASQSVSIAVLQRSMPDLPDLDVMDVRWRVPWNGMSSARSRHGKPVRSHAARSKSASSRERV